MAMEHFPSGTVILPRRTSARNEPAGTPPQHHRLRLSSLARRWKKNLALVLVYTFIVFTLASVVFFTEAIKREAAAVLQGAPRSSSRGSPPDGTTHPGRLHRNAEKHQRREQRQGPGLGYYYEPASGANYTIVASADAQLKPGTIAIGQGVARTLHAGVRDLLPSRQPAAPMPASRWPGSSRRSRSWCRRI